MFLIILIITSSPNTHHSNFDLLTILRPIFIPPSKSTFRFLETSIIMHFLRSSILAFVASLGPVAMAADCYSGSNIFSNDIRGLGDLFANNNINPPVGGEGVELKAQEVYSVSQGSAKACLYNDFLFENTHDRLADIAGGAYDIANQCCSTDVCGGGVYTVTGDSGLPTRLSIVQSGQGC